MRRTALILALLAAACASSKNPEQPKAAGEPEVVTSAEADSDLPDGKLPTYATPTAYALALTIDPDRDVFAGKVDIKVTLSEARDHIWIHGHGLRVQTAVVKLASGKTVNVRYREANADGVVRIGFPETLQPQDLTLSITYEATFGANLDGLYLATADDKHYAFAQFEAFSARLAFPCFDEPRFKAPFDITLTTRAEHVAISTTKETSVDQGGAMKTTHFATTEKLPTYLITFAVGDFDVVDGGQIPANQARSEPLPLRGVAVKGKGPLLKEALETTRQIVSAYEQYFGIGYAFGKLDIISVPDFAAGAMENAGAITFRDVLLLIDPATATVQQRRRSVIVIAHEVAHQWFGNLVTMAWWDDTWLNEAFASWVSYRTVQQWNPQLGAGLDRVEGSLDAMDMDWLPSTRAIRQPIVTNADILNAFDSITYEKGMGVLAMFEAYLGAEPFRKAVQAHLNKFKFANATADDFFASVSEATGKDVTAAFKSFVEQAGLPSVDVKLRCNAGAGARIGLKQSRYLPIGAHPDSEHSWQIPICARYESALASPRQECWLLDKPEMAVTLAGRGCPSWVMPNAHGAGYYRMSLDPQSLDSLVYAAQVRKLDAAEVATLASNVWAGLENGSISATAALRIASSLSASSDSRVAKVAMHIVEAIRDDVVEVGFIPNVEQFGRDLYKARAPKLFATPAKESDEARLTRVEVVEFMVNVARDPVVRAEAAKRGDQALEALEKDTPVAQVVDVDLLPAAIGAALDAGGPATHDRVTAVLGASDNPNLRRALLRGLTLSRDPQLAEKTLGLALDQRLRVNEIRFVVRPLGAQRETRGIAWQWIQKNFDALIARAAVNDRAMLPQFSASMCSTEDATAVTDFYTPRLSKLPGGPRSLTVASETIAACAAMANAQRESAQKFMATVKTKPAPASAPAAQSSTAQN